LEYAENPFEVASSGPHRKIFGLSLPLGGGEVARTFDDFDAGNANLYLSCGDSSTTDLASRSVDAVITDPPFFDNVHYSELADFFYVWQRYILDRDRTPASATTRRPGEVQSADGSVFAHRLETVFRECHRVLKDDGPLIFTYHHSRDQGWSSLLKAIVGAGFRVIAVQPIKSEMSVATPKSRAGRPIDLDVIIVCHKRDIPERARPSGDSILQESMTAARAQVARFARAGRSLGRGDVRVILAAHIVRLLSNLASELNAVDLLESVQGRLDSASEQLHNESRTVAVARVGQLSFHGLDATPAP
jgi:adenine-specific DNA methylase